MLNKIPETAIVIKEEDPYIAVDLNERLEIYLLKFDNLKVILDKRVLPDLVDALIELQNRK